MTWDLTAAAVSAAVGLVGGLAGPALIRALPEPQPDQPPEDDGRDDAGSDETAIPAVSEPKVPYAVLAARPGLGLKLGLVGAVVAGLVGGFLGFGAALPPCLFLSVVGVVLGYIDAQTRLLPTRIVATSYPVMVALLVVSTLAWGERGDLFRAGWGWLVMGGFYFVMWLVYPKGLGYGDVRLSGLLGLALGYLGWGQLVIGMYAGFLAGAVGGGLLALLRIVDRKRYPFGPFMLIGALAGIFWGHPLAGWYTSHL